MFEACICPEDEVLHIKCATYERAKQVVKDYYPDCCLMEITSDYVQTAIYERFEMDHTKMNHIGNIWRI